MKKNRILSLIAVVMAAIMMLCMTGCSQVVELLENYAVDDTEYIGADGDIYSLSLFDDLPEDYSDIDPLFWMVEGEDGNRVYLLGSIHCADTSAYRIPEHIMNAYLESDSLAVECNTLAFESDLIAQYQLTAQYYMYTDQSSIDQHISPELYDALVELTEEYDSELSELSYTLDVLNKCKPSVWMSLFDNITVQKAGLDTFLGIDYHFLNIATSQQKDIIEIESVEDQMAMLNGFSDELQELLLWEYVENDMDESAQATRELYEAWKIGDASMHTEEVEAESDEDIDISDYYGGNYTLEQIEELSEEYNNAMLTERNLIMVDAAEDMILGGQNVFYIVGLAHMVGEDGIVNQLTERGYDVIQLGGVGADGDASELVGSDEDEDEDDLPTSTAQNEEYDKMYDLYVELYEYYGGTTARTTSTASTTEKTSRTSRTSRTSAASEDDSEDDGWGGWGSSDNG